MVYGVVFMYKCCCTTQIIEEKKLFSKLLELATIGIPFSVSSLRLFSIPHEAMTIMKLPNANSIPIERNSPWSSTADGSGNDVVAYK